MKGLRCFSVVAFVLSIAATAAAQNAPSSGDQVARNLFNAGKVAYDAGDYQDALQFFEQSYERSHRSALLYNIGQAADRLRLDDKAIASFREYLQQTPDAPNRVEVENRIRALEQSRKAAAASAAPVNQTAPTAAPSPEQTARAAELPAPSAATQEPTRSAYTEDSGGGVTSKWWFWTTIGVVVVGGTIAAIALSSGGDADPAPLMTGDVGRTVFTLESR